jgi:hypothetical protein
VGGRGYILPVKEVRAKLHAATEDISTICDTLYDEINAPHWKPKLGELEKSDEDLEKLLEDAIGYINDPEGEAQEDMEEVEHRSAPSRFKKEEEKEDLGSKLPGGGDKGNEAQAPRSNRSETKQASSYRYSREDSSVLSPDDLAWGRGDVEVISVGGVAVGNSSVNPDELGGPRVDHMDRGEQTGPFGSYNRDEPLTEDQWGLEEGVGDAYNYPSDWDNNLLDKSSGGTVSDSGLPGAVTDRTPTEGYDFGIGYGNGNDAHGQGAGGYANPDSSGKGVYGPRAEMPGTTPVLKDETGLEGVEQSLSDLRAKLAGFMTVEELRDVLQEEKNNRQSEAELPNDGEPPVARSDYFDGPKGGNDMDVLVHHSQAELPGDGSPGGTTDSDRDLMNKSDVSEPVSEPYVRFDYTTTEMRPDYTYQRDPVQGPYVKQ